MGYWPYKLRLQSMQEKPGRLLWVAGLVLAFDLLVLGLFEGPADGLAEWPLQTAVQ